MKKGLKLSLAVMLALGIPMVQAETPLFTHIMKNSHIQAKLNMASMPLAFSRAYMEDNLRTVIDTLNSYEMMTLTMENAGTSDLACSLGLEIEPITFKICWGDQPAGILGAGGSVQYFWKGVAREESFITLNPVMQGNLADPEMLQAVLYHEILHTVGLYHYEGKTIMNPLITVYKKPQEVDIAALRFIFSAEPEEYPYFPKHCALNVRSDGIIRFPYVTKDGIARSVTLKLDAANFRLDVVSAGAPEAIDPACKGLVMQSDNTIFVPYLIYNRIVYKVWFRLIALPTDGAPTLHLAIQNGMKVSP